MRIKAKLNLQPVIIVAIVSDSYYTYGIYVPEGRSYLSRAKIAEFHDVEVPL